ncbi:MAG: Nif3-like dinuclear metal center hexameric protein [Clostridia bacterium]|nr:Nif3-like dinuclear metal center hexameric protein [Clostridia bacterium]
MAKLSEIYEIANGFAPKFLSDEYCQSRGAYDNSGLLVEVSDEVNKILFTLDLTNGAIDEAIETGCNLIITHHPVIYGKIGDIRISDDKLLGGKLTRCIQNGISVVSMHLNLDVAVDGIDESLMEGVCLSAGERVGAGMRVFDLMTPVQEGGYGRAYTLSGISLGELSENMKKTFSTDRILTYGAKDKVIKKAASFCGAGIDDESVAFAKEKGVDVVISSDFKHHFLQLLVESGISVIVLTHYASEQYGFEKYYQKIRQTVKIPCVYHKEYNLF